MKLMVYNPVAHIIERRLVATPARVTLQKGEACILGRKCEGVRIISGLAWITSQADVHALRSGEEVRFTTAQSDRVISAEGKTALVFEMLR